MSVDGLTVTQPGTLVDDATQAITVDGRPIAAEKHWYVALHKPIGYVSTVSDKHAPRKVIDLVRLPGNPRLVPAGRLDADSEGLIILSNDGDFVYKVTHPSQSLGKTYHATVKGTPSDEAIRTLSKGLMLPDEDRATAPAQARKIGKGPESGTFIVELVLHEGRNRQVRRMLDTVGHPVLRLVRVRIGPIWLADLPEGNWRELNPGEIRLIQEGYTGSQTATKTVSGRPIRPGSNYTARPAGDGPRPTGYARPTGGMARPAGEGRFSGSDNRPAGDGRPSGGSRYAGEGRPPHQLPPAGGFRPSGGPSSRPPRPAGVVRPAGDGRPGFNSGNNDSRPYSPRPQGNFGDGPRPPRPYPNDAPRAPRPGGGSGGYANGPRPPRPSGDNRFGSGDGPRPAGDVRSAGDARPASRGNNRPFRDYGNGGRGPQENRPYTPNRPAGDGRPDGGNRFSGGDRPAGDGRPRPQGGDNGRPPHNRPPQQRPYNDRSDRGPQNNRPAGRPSPSGRPYNGGGPKRPQNSQNRRNRPAGDGRPAGGTFRPAGSGRPSGNDRPAGGGRPVQGWKPR